MENERKIFYGTISVIIMILAVGSVFFNSNVNDGENYKYLSGPLGSYEYKGEISIAKNFTTPEVKTVPNLMLTHRSFDFAEINKISVEMGMKNPKIVEFSDYYDASTGNASLIVYKNGYKLSYTKTDVDIVNVTLSSEMLIKTANIYLHRMSDYIPKNVDIRVHSIINDRFDETVFDNGTIIDVYYTKDVIYDCYFKGYFVGLILKVEIDHSGNIVGFDSMPVKVSEQGTVNIKPFEDIHEWMEKGVPVTVSPKLIKHVEIKRVMFAILPEPTSFGAKFEPAYIVDIHIEGIEPAANDDYNVDIGGIVQ